MFLRIVVNKLKATIINFINENPFFISSIVGYFCPTVAGSHLNENAIQSKYAFPLVTSKSESCSSL